MSDPDAEPLSTLHSVPPGASFGRYNIVRRLGSGGMGSVYEAVHVELGKRVALKVLREKLAKNQLFLSRFLREGRVAAKLDHPHVVSVSDVGTHEGAPYLVMEFLAGTDFEVLLDQRGALPVTQAVDILLPILSALDAAHRAGLVHRDIKPSNIFLGKAPHGGFHPKLLDFGIAKPSDDEGGALTGTSDVFGTPQYMAPEQVRRSKDATGLADQYAMGAVLYRAITGFDAFEFAGASTFELLERVLAGNFPPPSERLATIDPAIERIILKAMARLPSERFDSVLELGAALLSFASPVARGMWSDAFSGVAEGEENEPTPSRAEESEAPNATVLVASASTQVKGNSGTELIPPSERLSLAAAEYDSQPSVARASRWRAAALAAVAVVGVIGYLALGRGPTAPPSTGVGAAGAEGPATQPVEALPRTPSTAEPQVGVGPAPTVAATATASATAPALEPVATATASAKVEKPKRPATPSAKPTATPSPAPTTKPTAGYTID